jgi:glucokinase
MILAGDVGGTTTRLALYEPGTPVRSPLLEGRLPSRDYATLEALLRDFLAAAPAPPRRMVLGIAGPILGRQVEGMNLPWRIAASSVCDQFDGAEVVLINDLEATAWGLTVLRDDEVETLHPGVPAPGNRALIAAGTGLGEAIILREADGWRPCASEGGHTDFGPRDPLEEELLRWLRERYGRVSYERIVSGGGLADLYRFLAATGRGEASAAVARAFAAAADPAAVVTSAALEGACGRARLALERFVSIYGAEAGNLALKALAVDGVFLAGGIAPRILPFLRAGEFVEAFMAKGRLRPLLARIPVRVLKDDRVGLWGAALRAGSTA